MPKDIARKPIDWVPPGTDLTGGKRVEIEQGIPRPKREIDERGRYQPEDLQLPLEKDDPFSEEAEWKRRQEEQKRRDEGGPEIHRIDFHKDR